MDRSTNVKSSKSKTSQNKTKLDNQKSPHVDAPHFGKQKVDKGLSEREIQIGLIESCNRLRIARPPRLDLTREIPMGGMRNDSIKIINGIQGRRKTPLEVESFEDINENVVADDDTGTDDEDYSIPEYSDSESEISTDAEELQQKSKTPIFEVERKVSMLFDPVKLAKSPKQSSGPNNELVIIREKKDSSSSVTDSNIDITQKDDSCHDQESSGDDHPEPFFREKVGEKWSEDEGDAIKDKNSEEDLEKNDDQSEANDIDAPSNTSVNTYTVHSEEDDDAGNSETQQGQLISSVTQYQQSSQFLPPLPWLSRFRQRYERPGWDSSPYNPNCNRPAWDEHLYIEARERFRRHEAVKSKTNGFEFQLFPVAMANYRPNSNYDQPIYDISIRKSSIQNNAVKSGSLTRTASKMSSPHLRRQQMSQSPGYPESLKDTNENVVTVSKENPRSLPSIDNNNVPTTAKTRVSFDTVPQTLQTNRNSSQSTDVNGNKSSTVAVKPPPNPGNGVFRTGSSTPKIVPFHLRDYSPSWRKLAQEERRKAALAAKEKPKEPEKPKVLNPLPRVALLCKANHRKSSSGCGGFYSPSMKPGVQIFDDRGRIKPQWDPSPYIPVGKKNAWDDSIPKSDYYRSKYIGWIM